MDAVIKILKCENIKDILFFENIITDITNPINENNQRVLINSLNYCVSIHDMPINYTDNNVFEFINKYERRFNRIIEYIKSNKKLCLYV